MSGYKQESIAGLAEFIRNSRRTLNISTAELADLARAKARAAGDNIGLSQQTISAFEQGRAKRMPGWAQYVYEALSELASDEGNRTFERGTASVDVEVLPTYAGAGGGGTGEGDVEKIAFSRALVEYELRAKPKDLLAIQIEGNSMTPDFQSGDQLLVDKRKTSLAQPGAFCLWDGDGYVVKYLEKIHDSEPPKVRVISRNEIYRTTERLAEEVQILGRVVWFARRV
ncbi:hypothetical protein L286_11800 [Sphingobium sp. HDIP04]|nr:hypothetical protein L286_11800 [Sphingobium sp. HDIP04]